MKYDKPMQSVTAWLAAAKRREKVLGKKEPGVKARYNVAHRRLENIMNNLPSAQSNR